MLGYEKAQKSLNLEQKQATGLLCIGTFLEYFDLMLYVHMVVLLNELFFPKAEPHTAKLYAAAAFCATFVFRPIGALIFGWIGDTIGRKPTVMITTFMMSISCLIMANLPTYAEIGVAAAWIMTICRIFQGMSSMGEIIGADLYLTELIKPPIQYFAVAILESFCVVGSFAALGIASLVTSFGLNWRIAFWIGAGIALIGGFARTALRETPDFVDARRQLTKTLEKANIDKKKIKNFYLYKEKTNLKTVLAFFLTDCAWPLGFYLTYIYCGDILRNNFNYTPEQVIHQNLLVSIIELFNAFLLIYLSTKIYPLKILKLKLSVFIIFVLMCPYLLYKAASPTHIFLIQSFIMLFGCFINPAFPIFYKHLPILKRFTYVSFSFATSRAVMYAITSFGVIYLTEFFGYWGLLFILVPVTIGFSYGINFFQKLEQAVGNYPKKLFQVHAEEN